MARLKSSGNELLALSKAYVIRCITKPYELNILHPAPRFRAALSGDWGPGEHANKEPTFTEIQDE
jgi:hypothetical protein